MKWYQQKSHEIIRLLHTGAKGLTTDAAEARQKSHGLNELKEAKQKSIAIMLLHQFKDLMILILLAAAVIAALLGEAADSVAIIIIVLLNAILGFFQEYRADKAMQALRKMTTTQSKVLRNGYITTLPENLLVPGDVVLLEAGDAVPADIRLTESIDLRTEEASLTGESQPVYKTSSVIEANDLEIGDQRNMVFKGTFVTGGRGTGIVVGTGMATELGRIAEMLEEDAPKTPLQIRMTSFGKYLSVIVLTICALFIGLGWLRGEEIIRIALTGISLAVAAIPEALPAVITISLALAAKRLVAMKALIKKLPALETLGCVTYICTDKTGTLTKNKMYVEEVFVNGSWFDKNAFYHHNLHRRNCYCRRWF